MFTLPSHARQTSPGALQVNALYYDPFSRLLLDYVGGAHDCKLRRLRTVAEPNASFAEDPCRLLRAVRHAARTGVECSSVSG